MLLLDDLQQFDTYSWQLLVLMASDVLTGLAVVSTMRPNEGSLALEARQVEGKTQIFNKIIQCLETLCGMPNVHFLSLAPFEPREVRSMVEMLLPGCNAVHESNIRIIHENSKGEPVHVEQMAYFLQSHLQMGWTGLETPGGVAELLSDGEGMVSMGDVIRSRLDKLRAQEQLTLKVCSVLGFFVSLELLEGAYPVARDNLRASLLADLAVLVESNFLVPEPGIPNMWRFENGVTQETVYEVIPLSSRRVLHARLALALQHLAEATPMKYPTTVIGYHWEQSCKGSEGPDWRRALTAIGCWKAAAELASSKCTFMEANRMFQKAVDLANTVFNLLETGQLFVTSDSAATAVPEDGDAAREVPADESIAGAMAANSSLTAVVSRFALATLHRRMAECYLMQFLQDEVRGAGGEWPGTSLRSPPWC